ncbi:MAG TPA: DUF6644 family protein [Candidatus Binatia bacterium]|nr:DUF6644 family protein [Candidatus Binatia bacterium]
MHPPTGPAWLVWLETTPLAAAMREWLWLYPIIEILHILGLAVLVGAAALFDLRLLGVSRSIRVTALAGHLLVWARRSLLLIVPTGLMMFTAHATEMASNPAFQLKLTLLIAAGVNAAAFHAGVFHGVASWDLEAPAPLAAKISAVLSLCLWAGVITCGRLLAYL